MAEEVFGTGRSKSDAKQVVAHKMLEQLSLRGYKVPPQFASPQAARIFEDQVGLPTHSFVGLVNEVCKQNRLKEVQYELFSDPAGQFKFTAKARIGYVERVATGSSKKIADNLAAEQVFKYLYARQIRLRRNNEEPTTSRTYETAVVLPFADETPDEQRRSAEEPGPSTSRTPLRRNRENNRRSTVDRLELNQPQQGRYEVGPEDAPPPEVLAILQPDITINFLSRTMNRLGI